MSSSSSILSSSSSSRSSSSSSSSSVQFHDAVRVRTIMNATVDMSKSERRKVWYSDDDLQRQRRVYRRLLEDLDDISYSDEHVWEGYGLLSLSYIEKRQKRVKKAIKYVQTLRSHGMYWLNDGTDDAESNNSKKYNNDSDDDNDDDNESFASFYSSTSMSSLTSQHHDDHSNNHEMDDFDDDFEYDYKSNKFVETNTRSNPEGELVSMLYSFESRQAAASAVERAAVIERQVHNETMQ